MGIAVLILGIISIGSLPLSLVLIPLGLPTPSGLVAILAISYSASVAGLILGIFALVKSKPNKRMTVAGVVMCSLGILVTTIYWFYWFY